MPFFRNLLSELYSLQLQKVWQKEFHFFRDRLLQQNKAKWCITSSVAGKNDRTLAYSTKSTNQMPIRVVVQLSGKRLGGQTGT